ncbi:hypothetical protein BQ8482_210059 [Mesorhizobium delmotii]|uniref:Uncharacterized protein n=1 Tax=Mesorhizobium delmotii TaxID=1631247 RepID=A0A2P9AL24_9HYPH|nr:hypothetical protein BQ8482_210059 [Mesorhizobium delmotii]
MCNIFLSLQYPGATPGTDAGWTIPVAVIGPKLGEIGKLTRAFIDNWWNCARALSQGILNFRRCLCV